MPLIPGQLFHYRYQVHTLLGQGGMGSVYRATDTVMRRVVAIKERTPDPNATAQGLAQARAQFEREAQILGALSHPNMPHVYDFFNANGNEYVVMEFIEGQNLQEAVQQYGAINEGAVRAWADQVLDALAYIHGQNIIHRDIKPANLILKQGGRVALVDFGLVKLIDPNNPNTATAMRGMGTAEYAPLEQFSPGMHTDVRSDIYSFGATLYHLLSGQAPLDVPRRLLNPNQQPTIRALNPKISAQMETTVARAMEVQPLARWQSARELKDQIAKIGPSKTTSASTSAQTALAHATLPGLNAQPCPNCGRQNPTDEIYCQTCAHKLGVERYCAVCGTPVLPNALACIECGTRF